MTTKLLFFTEITKDTEISKKTLTEFSALFKLKSFREKEHFVRIEEESNSVGFLAEGIMRTYIIDPDGNEAGLRFILPSNFVRGSFAGNVPSPVNIQCIETCSLYIADWNNIMGFMGTSPELRTFFNLLLSNGYSKTMTLLSNFIRLNAKDRYLLFIKEYPGLIDRIPHYLIANHLGITSVQLSRIRKNL